MDMRINAEKTEKVVNAFVEALTTDIDKLENLLRVLRGYGPATGMGYIISHVTKRVEGIITRFYDESL